MTLKANSIFKLNYQRAFNEELKNPDLKLSDPNFSLQFTNAFENSFKTIYKEAFEEEVNPNFWTSFLSEFNSSFQNINTSNFEEVFEKSFHVAFDKAYQNAYDLELNPSFKTAFNLKFNPKTKENTDFNEAFNKSFSSALIAGMRLITPNLSQLQIKNSNTNSNKDISANLEDILTQKFWEEINKKNKKSKNSLEKSFYKNFSNQYNQNIQNEYQENFKSEFASIFTAELSSVFPKIFNQSLSDSFTLKFIELFEESFDENVSPDNFKKSFSRAFNSAFEKSFEQTFKKPINKNFKFSFSRSFHATFINEENMPFSQNFERAFTPSFEQAFTQIISELNELFYGEDIRIDLEKKYGKPSTNLAHKNTNNDALVKFNSNSSTPLSTLKKQKMKINSTSIGSEVNPNQEFFNDHSVEAFIQKLKNTYNPVDRYTFMLENSEIIVTKYKTPDGTFEVLSDKDNRIQMLKNNLIVTENIFGPAQLDYYKKLEKLSNYDIKYDQITKVNFTQKEGLIFRVQVAAVSKNNLQIFNPLKIYGDITIDKQNNIYKYMIGSFSQMNQLSQTKRLIKQSIPDAFTVAYYHGQRIHMKHALQILLGNPQYMK